MLCDITLYSHSCTIDQYLSLLASLEKEIHLDVQAWVLFEIYISKYFNQGHIDLGTINFQTSIHKKSYIGLFSSIDLIPVFI